jgi:hypothetical protein
MSYLHSDPNQVLNSYPELNYGPGAKWIKGLTRSRLNNFNGGHFSDVNLSSVLFWHRVDDSTYVKLQVWSAPGLSKPTFEEAMQQKYTPAKKGDSFGPSCELFLAGSYVNLLTCLQGCVHLLNQPAGIFI